MCPCQGSPKHLSTAGATKTVRGWSGGCTRTFSLEKGGQRGDLVALLGSLTGRGRENRATQLLEMMCSDGARGDSGNLPLPFLDIRD